MSRILQGVVSLAVVAAAGCASTPAAGPSGAPGQGGTPVNPAQEVIGPSVKVVIDGKDQLTAFCAQAHTGYGPPCNYEPGTRPEPPTKVFCGHVSNELNLPVFVISWGNPPSDYNGPADPGRGSIFGQNPDESDKSLSGIVFESSDTEPHLVSLNEREITYSWMTNKTTPGHDFRHGNTVQVTKVGRTWHLTGLIYPDFGARRPGGLVPDVAHPFDVTVTCP